MVGEMKVPNEGDWSLEIKLTEEEEMLSEDVNEEFQGCTREDVMISEEVRDRQKRTGLWPMTES